MKTFLTIFVVATTLLMIPRGSESQIQIPTRPTAGPGPSGETNSGGSRSMTFMEDLMMAAGPNGQAVPYKMFLQFAQRNSGPGFPRLVSALRDVFMAGMKNSSILTSGNNSSAPDSPVRFMMQMQPDMTNMEDPIALNLLTLTAKGNVEIDTVDLVSEVERPTANRTIEFSEYNPEE